jgi:3-oxoacyl-[acyl-carrier protein] reductase
MSNRRVLITGASKGIGRAVADRVAAAGQEPIGLARTAPSDFPGQFHEVDLGDQAATAQTLDTIVGEGRVDAVVNNVGLARFGRIGSIHLDDLFLTYDLNVRTAVQVVQAVLPGMIDAGWGRVVNVTSLTTLGTPERTPYAAAKAALETELYRERSPAGSDREARLLNAIPLHRVGAPEEIAHVICMLLHDDASYLTGQVVRVDGGGSISAA